MDSGKTETWMLKTIADFHPDRMSEGIEIAPFLQIEFNSSQQRLGGGKHHFFRMIGSPQDCAMTSEDTNSSSMSMINERGFGNPRKHAETKILVRVKKDE